MSTSTVPRRLAAAPVPAVGPVAGLAAAIVIPLLGNRLRRGRGTIDR